MRKILHILLEAIFPEKCLGCKKNGVILCDLCLANIRSAERETARNIIACFDYRDPIIKKALWDLKYKNKRHIAEILGRELYSRNIEELADMKILSGIPILVIPVPLSKMRKKERGYNQAELIARHFIACAPAETFELASDAVVKIKNTPPQARIANRNKRLANIKGAFNLKENSQIRGRTIIIVDDITTTGGTINEIMKILKSAGARKITGFAVAH